MEIVSYPKLPSPRDVKIWAIRWILYHIPKRTCDGPFIWLTSTYFKGHLDGEKANGIESLNWVWVLGTRSNFSITFVLSFFTRAYVCVLCVLMQQWYLFWWRKWVVELLMFGGPERANTLTIFFSRFSLFEALWLYGPKRTYCLDTYSAIPVCKIRSYLMTGRSKYLKAILIFRGGLTCKTLYIIKLGKKKEKQFSSVLKLFEKLEFVYARSRNFGTLKWT